ncbi:hypothetical protein GGQ66_003486 [Rhizobium borbori]|uniref:Uncharacterized protein n=1 Tax=Allorhizobium borbori TaxID=485907 RepID=A0A7W6P3J4_9HYPH|nr:hypothetical protein [Allorhizobium borbori]
MPLDSREFQEQFPAMINARALISCTYFWAYR